MLVPATVPVKTVPFGRELPRDAQNAFRDLLRLLDDMQKVLAKVINANVADYVSQAARPTPDEGHTLIWKDSDAGPGTPKAYIVTTQGGVTYTFASVELV